MKRILTLLLVTIFMGSMLISCGGPEQTKKGLTKEQRERIDKDKKDFEKNLPDDEDDGR